MYKDLRSHVARLSRDAPEIAVRAHPFYAVRILARGQFHRYQLEKSFNQVREGRAGVKLKTRISACFGFQ